MNNEQTAPDNKTVFTKDFMIQNSGCYDDDKLMTCSFMQGESITLESIAASEIPVKDKFWFFCRKVASKERNHQIAIEVAEAVLPIYEAKHPGNMAPREAIEAAKQYIAGHISIERLLEKRRAAADAVAAAYAAAAYAAADAVAAAYAADAAAYAAAAYAAADAVAAAYAAAAAAYAAIKSQLQAILTTHIQSHINEHRS